jgi:predicted metalloprotease
LVNCLVKAFAKPLAARGIQLNKPKIKAYRKTIKTPCGRFGQRDAPAYYCSVTHTIYWPVAGDDANEAYTFARLGYVGLVAHEFGHHLQAESGMLREYGQRVFSTKSRGQRYLLSRRLELQAQCFEGVFLATGRPINRSDQQRSLPAAGLAHLHRRRGSAGRPQAGPWQQRGADSLAQSRNGLG